MSCPTCDHTMHSYEALFAQHPRVLHCPRCRTFEESLPPGNPPTVSYKDEWKRLGIAAAINKPEDRK